MAGTNNCWNNQIAGSFNQIILNAGTNGVAISTDASAATVNVATGGAVKTATFGSTNSTSATTVQSGSGALNVTATGGALTINSGVGALGISTDASATTVSFATGGAAKTVTLGSTNTTSSTAIKSGSGNIAMNSGLTVSSTGVATNTVQPAFLAYQSTSPTNVTGDGTSYTLALNTKVFDQGTNFNTSTHAFTAPVTGKYYFFMTALTLGASAAFTSFQYLLTTTAQTYNLVFLFPGSAYGASGVFGASGSIVVPMTAGDTATFTLVVAGSTKTVSIDGGQEFTFAGGYLVC